MNHNSKCASRNRGMYPGGHTRLCTDQRGFVEAGLWKASEEHLLALSQMNQVLGNVGRSSLLGDCPLMDGPG